MIDHVEDLHADFLAFYGIDIHRDTELTGPEFFSLARRTFAFEGVMAARWRNEEGGGHQAPERYEPVEQQAVAGRQDADVVDLAQFRVMFPGVVEHSTSSGGR